MSKDTTAKNGFRKRWESPRVERLIATDAENLYTPTAKDGIYSTS